MSATTPRDKPLPVPEVRELEGAEAAEAWRESAHGDLPLEPLERTFDKPSPAPGPAPR